MGRFATRVKPASKAIASSENSDPIPHSPRSLARSTSRVAAFDGPQLAGAKHSTPLRHCSGFSAEAAHMLNLIATRIRTAGTTIQNKRTSAVSLCLSIFLFIAAAASIQAQTPVTLSSSALPAVAQPGVQAVRLTVTKVPSGTILASSITVSLAPATPGTGPSAQVTASGFARVVGTTANVTFTVPAALTLRAPTVYCQHHGLCAGRRNLRQYEHLESDD